MASKFLNSFANIDEYNAYKESADYERPNVAYIIDEDRVIVDNGQPTTPDTPVDPNPPTPGDFDEGWLTGEFSDPNNVVVSQSKIRPFAFAYTNASRVVLDGGGGEYVFTNSSVSEVEFGENFNPESVVNLFRDTHFEHIPPIPAVVGGDISMRDIFYGAQRLKKVEFLATEPFGYLEGFYDSAIKKIIIHCGPGDWATIPDSVAWLFVPDEYVDAWKQSHSSIEEQGTKILPLSVEADYDENAVPEYIEYNGRLAITDPFGEIQRKIIYETGEDGEWTPQEGSPLRINFYKWNDGFGGYEMCLEEDGRYFTLSPAGDRIYYVDWRVPERNDWNDNPLLDENTGQPTFDAWNVNLTWWDPRNFEKESPMYSSESLTAPIPAPENGPAVTSAFEIHWDADNAMLIWSDTDGEFDNRVRDMNGGNFPDTFFPNWGPVGGNCYFYREGNLIAILNGDYFYFYEHDENDTTKGSIGFAIDDATDDYGQPLLDEEGTPQFDEFQINVYFNKSDGSLVDYTSDMISFEM